MSTLYIAVVTMLQLDLLRRLVLICSLVVVSAVVVDVRAASPIVPGTGAKVTNVGDDFEDENWGFVHNFPKSSEELDEQKRYPTGQATNGRWYEGIKRGQPDFLKRVPTPEGGLAGSQGSLLMTTLNSGIPGNRSFQMQQDDLILNIHTQMRGMIPISQEPNCVVRVYMPPFEKWEDRSGATFGFRISLQTHAWKEPEEKSRSIFSSNRKEYLPETYWPGMFVQFRSESDRRNQTDSAYFTIRGNQRGGDFKGPEITQTGWWTLGMSCTSDGMVHYYISPGIDDLTPEDYVTSQFPYGYKAEQFRTFFFNVCNRDDGRTWATPWIIDDPTLYLGNGHRVVASR